MSRSVTASAGIANTFTDKIRLNKEFNISISGTWAGTVTLQRSFDGGTTYVDVETFTANAEKTGSEVEGGVDYRLGIKTGEYTSGSAKLRLSHS